MKFHYAELQSARLDLPLYSLLIQTFSAGFKFQCPPYIHRDIQQFFPKAKVCRRKKLLKSLSESYIKYTLKTS
jgi:hypothetical protein